MVEFCRDELQRVEGLDEESVEKWRELRLEFIEETHGHLSAEHFDNLPGHGSLPSSPSLHPNVKYRVR